MAGITEKSWNPLWLVCFAPTGVLKTAQMIAVEDAVVTISRAVTDMALMMMTMNANNVVVCVHRAAFICCVSLVVARAIQIVQRTTWETSADLPTQMDARTSLLLIVRIALVGGAVNRNMGVMVVADTAVLLVGDL